MECGCEAGQEMGVNTWASFAGTDDDAVVDGDFACQESELQPVLKALCGAGIRVVAIHHHMTGEEPLYIFLHYWGRGQAVDLARALQRARGEQTKAAAAAARTQGGFKEIGSEDYEKHRAAGHAVVLDVRSAEEFALLRSTWNRGGSFTACQAAGKTIEEPGTGTKRLPTMFPNRSVSGIHPSTPRER
jgi:hypothetical protein